VFLSTVQVDFVQRPQQAIHGQFVCPSSGIMHVICSGNICKWCRSGTHPRPAGACIVQPVGFFSGLLHQQHDDDVSSSAYSVCCVACDKAALVLKGNVGMAPACVDISCCCLPCCVS
jgi:hypothetical protein